MWISDDWQESGWADSTERWEDSAEQWNEGTEHWVDEAEVGNDQWEKECEVWENKNYDETCANEVGNTLEHNCAEGETCDDKHNSQGEKDWDHQWEEDWDGDWREEWEGELGGEWEGELGGDWEGKWAEEQEVHKQQEPISDLAVLAWCVPNAIEGSCSSHSWEEWEPKPDWTEQNYKDYFDAKEADNHYGMTEELIAYNLLWCCTSHTHQGIAPSYIIYMSLQEDWEDALTEAIDDDPESVKAALSQPSSPIKHSDQHQLPATKFLNNQHKTQTHFWFQMLTSC